MAKGRENKVRMGFCAFSLSLIFRNEGHGAVGLIPLRCHNKGLPIHLSFLSSKPFLFVFGALAGTATKVSVV